MYLAVSWYHIVCFYLLSTTVIDEAPLPPGEVTSDPFVAKSVLFSLGNILRRTASRITSIFKSSSRDFLGANVQWMAFPVFASVSALVFGVAGATSPQRNLSTFLFVSSSTKRVSSR